MSMNRKQRRLQEKKLGKKHKVTKSIAQQAEALRKNKGNAEVERLHKLGRQYMDSGDLIKATETFAQVLRLKPDHILTIEQMTLASQLLKRFDSAEIFLKALLEIDPSYTRAYGYLGKFYLSMQDEEKAMEYLEQGHKLFPDDSEILNALAVVAHRTGKDDEAQSYFKQAYDSEPNITNIITWMNTSHKVKSKNDFVFRELLKYEKRAEKAPSHSRAMIYSSLGNAHDQLKEYDAAFGYYKNMAKTIRESINYDVRSYLKLMTRLKTYFSKEFFETQATQFKGNPTEEPVFVLGMPRSGSTLIEQILDSHPDICGVGEAKFLSSAIYEKLKMPATQNDVAFPVNRKVEMASMLYGIDGLAKDYLGFLRAHDANAKRYVDKALSHYLWIGVILLAFPNAKIIHSKRNALDSCLSCFQRVFNNYSQEFSYDLTELGLYCRAYNELMEHWHDVLPGKILDVQYEDVVNDIETQTKRMLDFIGMPFDEKCLEFYKNERFVFTSSAGQINKPIYKTAMNKWKRYEGHLAPLVKALGPYAPEDSLYLIENSK